MPIHRELFPEDTLFHRIARTVCRAGFLPGKELSEDWETARWVRRRPGGGSGPRPTAKSRLLRGQPD